MTNEEYECLLKQIADAEKANPELKKQREIEKKKTDLIEVINSSNDLDRLNFCINYIQGFKYQMRGFTEFREFYMNGKKLYSKFGNNNPIPIIGVKLIDKEWVVVPETSEGFGRGKANYANSLPKDTQDYLKSLNRTFARWDSMSEDEQDEYIQQVQSERNFNEDMKQKEMEAKEKGYPSYEAMLRAENPISVNTSMDQQIRSEGWEVDN